MKKNITRRKIVQAAVLAGGVLIADSFASAATKAKPMEDIGIEGEWLAEDGQLCAVFKQGRVLLVVNPLGSVGVAHLGKSMDLLVIGGVGWDAGLVGKIARDGKRINWSNSTVWLRH